MVLLVDLDREAVVLVLLANFLSIIVLVVLVVLGQYSLMISLDLLLLHMEHLVPQLVDTLLGVAGVHVLTKDLYTLVKVVLVAVVMVLEVVLVQRDLQTLAVAAVEVVLKAHTLLLLIEFILVVLVAVELSLLDIEPTNINN